MVAAEVGFPEVASSIAVLIGAYVGWLTVRTKRLADAGTERVDSLTLGHTALKDALAQAAMDKTDLRAEIATLRTRLDQTEERERQCWERVTELQHRVEEME